MGDKLKGYIKHNGALCPISGGNGLQLTAQQLANLNADHSKYLTEHQSLDNYCTWAEVEGLAGGVTSVNGQTGAVEITVPHVNDNYLATSTDAMSGKAVASALANYLPLTGGQVTGPITGKTIDAASTITVTAGTMFRYGALEDTTFTFRGTLTGNYVFCLLLSNGGSYTITWPRSVRWASGFAPNLTSGGTDLLTFVTTNGSEWIGIVSVLDIKMVS